MKVTKIAALILALIMACTLLSACGGGGANDELINWTKNEGKTFADAQTKFDAEHEQAVANGDPEAAKAAINTIIEAANIAKSSLEKIDRSKLSDANKNSYDQNLNNITESLQIYEEGLAQY